MPSSKGINQRNKQVSVFMPAKGHLAPFASRGSERSQLKALLLICCVKFPRSDCMWKAGGSCLWVFFFTGDSCQDCETKHLSPLTPHGKGSALSRNLFLFLLSKKAAGLYGWCWKLNVSVCSGMFQRYLVEFSRRLWRCPIHEFCD